MSPSSKNYGVIAEFPLEDREKILQELVHKAGGVCLLCESPIDMDADSWIIEHKDNQGPTETWNLYIAHRSCNTLKSDLPYQDAKVMIMFRKFCESKGYNITFDDILNKYVGKKARQVVKIVLDDKKATVVFSGEKKVTTSLFVDPATDTKYFFAEVPVEYIHNDVQVQPRRIEWDHAWTMALDFQKHPVHEPSSCRIDLSAVGSGKLFQFDGQHKTTAQVLMGRNAIQTKIYVNPQVSMIKELILAIQNRIKKKPLAPAIHLAKMRDVYLAKLQSSGATSEHAFVQSYLMRERANAKKEVFSSIYQNIIEDPSNRFRVYIQPEGTRAGRFPLSMNLVTNYILKSLVCQELQKMPIGSSKDFRIQESANIIFVLNTLADELLENGKWPLQQQPDESSIDHLKARRFFKSGAVRYWNSVLNGSIAQRLNLLDQSDRVRFLLRPLEEAQRDLVRLVVRRLASHPIWTNPDGNIDSKLNENKKETSEALFRDYKLPLKVEYLLDIK
jgi:hypothetical protein